MEIQDVIDRYTARYPNEAKKLEPLRKLISEGAHILSRKEFRGHVTCGAMVLNAAGAVLMVRHRALDRWLLPGGHIEGLDTSLMEAARREVSEECGIAASSLKESMKVPIDIDRHWIPANESKNEPKHEHWDFRYLFRTDTEVLTMQVAEVIELGWRPLDQLSEHLRWKLEKVDASWS